MLGLKLNHVSKRGHWWSLPESLLTIFNWTLKNKFYVKYESKLKTFFKEMLLKMSAKCLWICPGLYVLKTVCKIENSQPDDRNQPGPWQKSFITKIFRIQLVPAYWSGVGNQQKNTSATFHIPCYDASNFIIVKCQIIEKLFVHLSKLKEKSSLL